MPYLDPASYELPFASNSDTSHDAAVRARDFVGVQGETVAAWFTAQGDHGGTQREASEALGIGRPSTAARCHALEQHGRIAKTTARRDGCAVYQVD